MKFLKEHGRSVVCVVLVLTIFCIYGLRLADWQIIQGQEYRDLAERTSTTTQKMTAARGEILDVNGEALAVNRTVYCIQFDKTSIPSGKELNDEILTLIQLLEKRDEEWEDELPIIVDANGNYAFAPNKEDEVESLISEYRLNTYATAEECMYWMQDQFNTADEDEPSDFEGYTKEELRSILSVRYNMVKTGFAVSDPYTFAFGISSDTVGIISENSQSLPGVTVQVTTQREYPDGDLMPQILGSIGLIDADDYKKAQEENNTYSVDNPSGYAYNDRIGKGGIEEQFESELRGQNGLRVIETTPQGSLASSTVTEEPQAGNTIYLTLDSRIQAVANASLAKNVPATAEYGKQMVELTGESGHGEECVAGAAVVLRVEDFSVLAAATFPNYDLNRYQEDPDYFTQLNEDETRPMFNRAFDGTFAPGSCFKPIVALGALQENVITGNDTVFCNHTYTYWDDYQPTCMGWHGTMNVASALQKSCNIFFYDVGRRLGVDMINLYAKSMGCGVRTGVEIGEAEGTLSGPQYDSNWQGGQVVQAAIGQSNDSFSPLQLATAAATIANDGVRLETHVVDKITNYARDTVLQEKEAVVAQETGISQENLDLVKQGMRAVCQYGGTAAGTFGNYGIAIAGKTGTAEITGHSDNVTFIGFAPYDDPEIAVAVVLEYGANSAYSLAVAKDLFDAYFYGTYVDEQGNIVFPGTENTEEGLSSAASSSPEE